MATSRRAAIRYQEWLTTARDRLLARIDALTPSQLQLSEEALESKDKETQFLVRAARRRDLIARFEIAAVISGNNNDDPGWKEWSDKGKVETRVERFKKPLIHKDPSKCDPLAILCVKSMLLTGFDAPLEQVMYVDRFMQGADLLQAIARVNRTAAKKTCGLIVDYYGVGRRLREALAVYTDEDVEGVATDIAEELPKLRDRHARVIDLFRERGIDDIARINDCVDLLADTKVRAEFLVRLKAFLTTFELFRTRPEGRPYVRDVKLMGFIAKMAANLYRDEQLNLAGVGQKVRELIDEYIIAKGIDPKVPPTAITAPDFIKAVDRQPSKRAKASEMEHAARYHITIHFNEDPAYYKKLSERLEAILTKFKDNWEELITVLKEFTSQVRAGRPADESGLDPRTQAPFLSLLVEEVEAGGQKVPKETLRKLAEMTVELVEHVRQEIRVVDFWRNVQAQNVLRQWIIQQLDQDVLPFERLPEVAGRLVELARALHTRLTA